MSGGGAVVRGAALYAAVVFAAGFVLGTARVLALEPVLGRPVSVLVEIPLMLVLSWVACRWAMRGVPTDFTSRALAGVVAFSLLMAAEGLVAVALFGRSPADVFAGLRHPAELPGLLAQVAFGLFPLVQARFPRSG